jgi:hypothetical protein
MRRAAALAFFLTTVALLSAAPTTAAGAEGRPTLYVFVQTDVRSSVLEKALQAKLPALAVTVFGRFRDFEEALASRAPDAVLALAPLLVARQLDPIVLRGVSNGRDVDTFVLVHTDLGLAAMEGALANRTIGVVDLFGRKGTQDFAAALLKESSIRVKLVTRTDDLLSLLQFSAADAVLVPSDLVQTFKERSRLSLHVRTIPGATVERVAVSVLNPAVNDLITRQLRALDAPTSQMMGIDGWRSR